MKNMKNFALESFKNPNLPLYKPGERNPQNKRIKDFQLNASSKFNYTKFHKERCYLGSLFGEDNCTEEYITTSRMIVGKGDASVFETSIALHSLHGYPYIPSEAVDGVVRRYMIEQYFKNKEEKAQKCPFFCHLFGSTDNSKALHIFDVLPVDVTVEYNIMTAHYGDYNSKQEAPSDAGNPNPLKYPVVAKNSKFQFSYAVKADNRVFNWVSSKTCTNCPHNNNGGCKFNQKDCLQFASELLENTLIENGVGGKTTSGLGRLKKH
jgi:CRISPR-associated protein Cmr6